MSTTEASSNYQNLERMSVQELLHNINREDQTVPTAIARVIDRIEPLVDVIVSRMASGGRLFYIGAGTSGRLGIIDASEIPPTYGVSHGHVIGIMAGGDKAIRKAAEFAEDNDQQAWIDLQEYQINNKDVLIGIAASGRTPYVIGGVKTARANGIATGCIVCNAGSALAKEVEFPVEVITGPEFVTGSTRMKAGTAQKLVLNMITTTVMIKLGHVVGNKMVDMQLTNLKLVERGVRMIVEETGVPTEKAEQLLKQHGSVRKAIDAWKHAQH